MKMEFDLRLTDPYRPQRMAVLVTRESHCLEGLIAAWRAGRMQKAQPSIIVSNRRELEPLIKGFELPFVMINWSQRAAAEGKLLKVLDDYEIDFVVLARFMKILSPNVVWWYKNKIINIHPSLLPSFPGAQAYRQAYEHGVKIAGVTAHFVNMHLDEGPIIAQASFRIRPKWTLNEIVAAGQRLETKILVSAVERYAADSLDVSWGTVKHV